MPDGEGSARTLVRVQRPNVRFLVVGGYAYSHYTEPHAIKDLDLFVEATEENAALVFASLAAFGAPLAGMSPKDFQDIDSFYQLGVAPNRIDILQHIDGVDVGLAWRMSEPGMIGDDIPVRYISFDDLVKNELAVGRLRDLADVEELQAAQAANLKLPEKEWLPCLNGVKAHQWFLLPAINRLNP